MMNEFICSRGGMKIYGGSYVPDTGAKNYPTVIMCHGFNGSYAGNVKYADILARNGFACVMFDFCGGSLRSRSDGDMTDMTVSSEVDDLKSVIAYTGELEFADTKNIFLMGKSQGGAVAALTAADMPDRIKGLMLLYPAFMIPAAARRMKEKFDVVPETYEMLGGVVGRSYFYEALGLDMSKCFTYGKNVLIIQGDSDDIVPLVSSKRAAMKYPSAELRVIEGAGHGFKGETVKKACAMMIDFLKRNT